MPAEQTDGFADNWAYLRTELHWLERLLMAAVAKQRKEAKEIDRVAQSKADRATSHWWKGIITAEGNIAYDEYRQPAGVKTSYSSQIEAQIQASQRQGIVLALPALRDRLGLNLFEKNLVLMSLAPEVNRRYSKLYHYLQGEDSPAKTDLPTLDLVLRLLCKNDQEWRVARNHLMGSSRLIRHKLLNFLPAAENTLLNAPLKLSVPLINYLLADHPTLQTLDELLTPADATKPTEPATPALIRKVPRVATPVLLQHITLTQIWSDLVLPTSTIEQLQQMAKRIQGYSAAIENWNLASEAMVPPGLVALLTGEPGTGKTAAALALATELQTPLWQVDLAAIDPIDYTDLLSEIRTTAPTVLLIDSAQVWLKRTALVSAVQLQQFWTERRQQAAITLFSLTHSAAVQVRWQRQLDQQIQFVPPGAIERLLLWQNAFPAKVPLESDINWTALAELPLNRREIQTLGQEAICYAAAESASAVSLSHILQALVQYGWRVEIQPLRPKRRSKKKTEA